MNRVYYALAGALLLVAAGLVHAQASDTTSYGYYNSNFDGAPLSSQPAPADGSFGVSVDVSVTGGGYYSPSYGSYGYYSGYGAYPSYPYYTHYCTYSYYYGNYVCYGAAPRYAVPYCDPFDPYYYIYCLYPSYGLYPTYYANPGTIVYVNGGGSGNVVYANRFQQAQPPQPSAPPCSDGTLPGTCSSDYPKYCLGVGNQSQLIDKATLCGCPAGQSQDPNNRNRCVTATCSDGTAVNTCSASKPSFCTSNQVLVERPSQCGCPAGSRLEGDACVPFQNSCFIFSVSPQTVRQGQSASVVVEYSEIQDPTGYAQCGDGLTASLSCQRRADGLRGSCTATCTYQQASDQPRIVRAFLGGNSCAGSGSVNVVPQQASVGGALVKVTSCSTGLDLAGADVSLAGQHLVTNAHGEALFASLTPGQITASASKSGYLPATSTVNVDAGGAGVTPLCLNVNTAPACDVTLVAGDASSGDLRNSVELLLTNHRQSPSSVSLTYSSALPLNGPSNVNLAPGETRVLTLMPSIPSDFAGSALAAVTSVFDAGQCSSTVRFPLSVSSGISLQAIGDEKVARAGERVCFDFLARNRASQQSEVRLAATLVPSGNANTNVELSQQRFVLLAGQTKQVQACVQVPEGSSQDYELRLGAVSAINTANSVVTIRGSGGMQSNENGCYDVSSNHSQFVDVVLRNGGRSGSFYARLAPSNGLSARLVQDSLFNFANNTSRSLAVQVDPLTLPNAEGRALLTVYDRSSDVKVFERQLCFRSTAEERADSLVFTAPNRIWVEAGRTAYAFVHVRNTGNVADTYDVEAASPFENAELLQQRLTLQPGQERSVTLELNPGADVEEGAYTLPVAVYSRRDDTFRQQVGLDTLTIDVTHSAPQTPLRLAKVGSAKVEFVQLQSIVRVQMNFTNQDGRALTITPSLQGLPSGWSYSVSPTQASIGQLATAGFTFEITPTKLEQRDYNLTAIFTDQYGRQVREPITLPAKSAGWITGLFVLGSTSQLFAVLIVLLVLAGLYLVYRAWQMHKEVQQEQGLRA